MHIDDLPQVTNICFRQFDHDINYLVARSFVKKISSLRCLLLSYRSNAPYPFSMIFISATDCPVEPHSSITAEHPHVSQRGPNEAYPLRRRENISIYCGLAGNEFGPHSDFTFPSKEIATSAGVTPWAGLDQGVLLGVFVSKKSKNQKINKIK